MAAIPTFIARPMKPREYVSEAAALSTLEYQVRQYRNTPRESDKVILSLLRELSGTLLDIGCSNGNLLKQIRDAFAFDLCGGDLSPLRIDICRKDSGLAGIRFEVMDIMELPSGSFDVVVANAVLCLLSEADYQKAISSIARALKPSGTLIAFDWMHEFDQELAVTERTPEIPEGIHLYFRSFRTVRAILSRHGFGDARFMPFAIPIDLEAAPGTVNTRTIRSAEGGRLQFRGALYQPWCHLAATRM